MQQNELQEQQATEAQKISNEELQLHKVTTLHSDKGVLIQIYCIEVS